MKQHMLKSASLLILIVSLLSCKRNISEANDQHKYFFKRFGSNNNEGFQFIHSGTTGKISVAGFLNTDTMSNCLLAEFDQYGQQRTSNFMSLGLTSITRGSRFMDGSFVVSDFTQDWIAEYDAAGTFIREHRYLAGGNNYFIHGKPSKLNNGEIGLGMTNGFGAGKSTNQLLLLDDNLDLKSFYALTEQDVNGHLCQLELDRMDGDYIYYSGTILPNPWTFSNPCRAFVARLNLLDPASNFIHLLAPIDTFGDDFQIDKVNLKDDGIVQVLSKGFWIFSKTKDDGGRYFQVVNWDKDRNLRWRKTMDLGYEIHSPYSASVNAKGELLVVGSLKNGKSDPSVPFVVKLDPDGNILWKKVYLEIFDGIFTDVHETNQGDLVFSGIIEIFGKKLEGSDGLILKTDAHGNY
ncbi:MAG: hypothetical protein GC180_03745 [Bacteroidetes bacterium]|nr:hypothetical protein [Bacteroidota bacterium]